MTELSETQVALTKATSHTTQGQLRELLNDN